MTLRSLALSALLISLLSALLLAEVSSTKFHFYEELLTKSRQLLSQAGQPEPSRVTENQAHTVPLQGVARLLVVSPDEKRLRIEYFQKGHLKVIERLGENGNPARRDYLDDKNRVRAQEFLDEEGHLVQTDFLDEQGEVVHRKVPPVLPPPRGWVYAT